MNKAFENILERLEKERRILLENNIQQAIALNFAKGIVQEVAEEYNGGWIPCSEKLPEDRDWHLAVFEEVDTGFIGLPYIADYLMGAHTKYTTNDGWILHNCTDGEDGSGEYYKNLRCVAWQRLPEPYKAE